MSKGEAPLGLAIMEKVIGFFVMLIGIILFYITYTDVSSVVSHPIIFLVAGLILIGLGIVMLIAKTE